MNPGESVLWNIQQLQTHGHAMGADLNTMVSRQVLSVEGIRGEIQLFLDTARIPDRPILEFLADHQGRWSTYGPGYAMPTVRDAMPAGTPDEVQQAKMCTILWRRWSGGCPCGCRGDWEITDLGLAVIGRARTKLYTGYGNY